MQVYDAVVTVETLLGQLELTPIVACVVFYTRMTLQSNAKGGRISLEIGSSQQMNSICNNSSDVEIRECSLSSVSALSRYWSPFLSNQMCEKLPNSKF